MAEASMDNRMRSAIRRAVQEVKDGKAGLQQEDLDSIMKQDKEVLEKFLVYVVKGVLVSKLELDLAALRSSDTNNKQPPVAMMEAAGTAQKTELNIYEEETDDTDDEKDPDEREEGEKPKASKPRDGEEVTTTKENQPQQTEDMEVDKDEEKPQESKKRMSSDNVEDNDEEKKMPAKKKAKKKRQSAPSAKDVEASRTAAKQEFESKKAEILDEIPEEYKDRWGQIGFAKWGKEWLACLIVGPYDVGPMSVGRTQWMQMFENTKGRRHAMELLIYWYGSDDLSPAYSFVQPKTFKSYEEGVKKNLDKMPPRIQKKVDAGRKPLTKKERELLAGIEEMREDLEKSPEERRIREPFEELYEMDRYVESLAAGAGDGGSSDDKELQSDSEQEVEDEDESDTDSFQEVVELSKAKKSTKGKTLVMTKKLAKAPPAEDFVDDV